MYGDLQDLYSCNVFYFLDKRKISPVILTPRSKNTLNTRSLVRTASLGRPGDSAHGLSGTRGMKAPPRMRAAHSWFTAPTSHPAGLGWRAQCGGDHLHSGCSLSSILCIQAQPLSQIFSPQIQSPTPSILIVLEGSLPNHRPLIPKACCTEPDTHNCLEYCFP